MSSSLTINRKTREKRVAAASGKYSGSLWAWITKIALLGILDAIAVYGVMTAIAHSSPLMAIVIAAVAIIVTVIYVPPNRMLPAKYLAPGIIFMVFFSVGVMAYTIYVGSTNYGDGHNGSRDDAVAAIQRNHQERVPNAPAYNSSVAEKDGKLALIVIDPDTKKVQAGTPDQPLEPVKGAELNSLGKIKNLPGYRVLAFSEVSQRSDEISQLQVPVSKNSSARFIRTTTGSQAFEFISTITYDKNAGTMTDKKGTVYRENGRGNFVSVSGKALEPDWKVTVGFSNFKKALTDHDVRRPFLRVTAWTFAFAVLSVLTTFALGLALALLFNDASMKGQQTYRILMLLPYAFPGFLSALVWSGMFNQEFGLINQVLLGGVSIPWLTNPWIAKAAVLIVNVWLGFPYMFIISTGALQSIPSDILEASWIDGASTWRTFTKIKLPLLMVPLAPLLISSFAFNFNNFVLIYMLTLGGPRFTDTSLDVGATDILISMVYKVAFSGAQRDYGLASAFSVIIFIIVGVISWLGFRQTKTLEEVN
ncbi:ABC transporter permease subunit [Cutibacterium acnes]|uniref:ABC transporter permease subunit n=1 Tax=Cutibacterium acnes TaxID=1747 RepID=UPI00022FA025|nr:ABC transporter permease subunit [Cutibacterium acnes]AER04683.1 maltose transport system permease protein MalF [Cutibacterium acnes subsp. defendens ATCC 11828]